MNNLMRVSSSVNAFRKADIFSLWVPSPRGSLMRQCMTCGFPGQREGIPSGAWEPKLITKFTGAAS